MEAHATSNSWEAPRPVFDDAWIAFRRVSGPPLSPVDTTRVTRALRRVLLRHADQPVLEVLSGHQPDGRPSATPHAAYLALPDVGRRQSAGAVVGLAIALPRAASDHEHTAANRAVIAWESHVRRRGPRAPGLPLYCGRLGVLTLEPVVHGVPGHALRPLTWCRPSLRWASVTPIVLDRYPGKLRSRNPRVAAGAEARAREIIAGSCQRIGLPRPWRVDIGWDSPVPGAPPSPSFPPYPGISGRQQRFFVHAVLTFAFPVFGPVILGAGRYEGMGLMHPL